MRIILARPRGFCAGVERAIRCVERALDKYGAPVYVLNDIVHNAAVVSSLRDEGAVFVKRLEDVPRGAHLLFSAHGVGPEAWAAARARGLDVIDATCPLVEKVHREARRYAEEGYTIVLIGEAGHDEVRGTRGQAPEHIKVVFSREDVDRLEVDDPNKAAFLTQTTLSVDQCRHVIDRLRQRLPAIIGPSSDDICYATQNRQRAVIQLADEADLVLVVGDAASANSRRLAEICSNHCKESHLIASADMVEDVWLHGVSTVLITAGASAPETLVQGVVDYLRSREPSEVEERTVIEEDIHFRLPPAIA